MCRYFLSLMNVLLDIILNSIQGQDYLCVGKTDISRTGVGNGLVCLIVKHLKLYKTQTKCNTNPLQECSNLFFCFFVFLVKGIHNCCCHTALWCQQRDNIFHHPYNWLLISCRHLCNRRTFLFISEIAATMCLIICQIKNELLRNCSQFNRWTK